MNDTISQLTERLWVAQSRFYATNSGILLSGDHACLIDPCMTPGEIERIAAFLANRRASPQVILLTHSHWDHILGPEVFPGIKTIAQANFLTEVIGKRGARIQHQIKEWETENEIERAFKRTFEIPRPDEVFVDKLSLDISDDISLALVHAPGHAADQMVIYHAKSRTLWAADMLSDLEIPFVSDSLVAYQETLAMLSEWDIEILVPGHGHATTDRAEIRGRLSDDIAYLAELRDKVERAIRSGQSVADAVAACDQMDYRFPRQNEGPHKLNVESAYVELGGEANPEKVGWSGLAAEGLDV